MIRDRSSNPERPRRNGLGWERLAVLALAASAALAAPAARAADAVSVPVSAKARQAVPLPPGEKIELSLQQTVALTLQNVLDLDVASYSLDEARFGIQSAKGAFDPFVELDLEASDSQNADGIAAPVDRRRKRRAANFTFGGPSALRHHVFPRLDELAGRTR